MSRPEKARAPTSVCRGASRLRVRRSDAHAAANGGLTGASATAQSAL